MPSVTESGAVSLEEGEEVRVRERTHLYINERCDGTGELLVTTRRVVWVPEAPGARGLSGFSLFYPAIVMHAVSRDTSAFPHACLFMQLDPEQNIGELASAQTTPQPRGAKRTRVANGGGSAEGLVNGNGEAAEAAHEEGDDESEGEGEEEAGWEDIRLVPAGEASEAAAGGDALERIYAAMSECAALNPDPADEESEEGEEGEEGMMPGDGVLFTSPDALSSMTLQQEGAARRRARTAAP